MEKIGILLGCLVSAIIIFLLLYAVSDCYIEFNLFYSDYDIFTMVDYKIKACNIDNRKRIQAIENEMRFQCSTKRLKTKRWVVKTINKVVEDTAYLDYSDFLN